MRKKLLSKAKRVIVKIGSGVISDTSGLEVSIIDAICEQICALRSRGIEVILVSSGAVAAGKGDLGIDGRPATIPQKQAAAAIGQSRMMRTYKEAFLARGQKVAQILLTRDDIANRRRYLNARNTLMTLLEYRVTPIINENDSVVVDEIRFGDNDNLSAMVAALAEANLLVILSDVDGLYDSDPTKNPDARLIPEVPRITPQIESMAGGSGTTLGTGGMTTKIKAAKRASLSGLGTIIVNGRTPNILTRLFEGKEVGTLFLPSSSRMTAKKHWIAFAKKPRGKLFVDEGARQALEQRGKSLLPSGVKAVEGQFDRGDAVRLFDLNGLEFARGVADYSMSEILRIMGKKSSDIEEILGYKYGDDVIHRDNLVLKKD